MASAAEMPQQDEALKALVSRFKEDPSRTFVQLAAALLARGHAGEALRVAEHGLQIQPDNVEGRVERSAALLALGRPRVAYVELRRALAIDPVHRRGMRLLGKAFVDAGAPSRAAELLKKRSEATHVADDAPAVAAPAKSAPRADVSDLLGPTQAPEAKAVRAEAPEPEHEIPPPPPPKGGARDLFADLTADLGLGAAIPEVPTRRVEVTQIIRRKAVPRPPRSASELAEIEGPIVDTTQPGELQEVQQDEAPASPKIKAPGPLFGAEEAAFALDDEPLFQEHLPFDVRPVETNDLDETTLESVEAPGKKPVGPAPSKDADTVVEHIEAQAKPLEQVSLKAPPPLNEDLEEPPPLANIGAKVDPRPGQAERKGRSRRVEIVDPSPRKSHVALGVFAALLMVGYLVLLLWLFADEMRIWLPGGAEVKGTPPPTTRVDSASEAARAEP